MNFKTVTAGVALLAMFVGSIMAQTIKVDGGVNAKQEAIKAAISKMGDPIKASKIGDKSVSFFFVEGDENGAIETYARNLFVEAGKSVVVPNDDENKLLKEIYSQMEFDERKAGILAPGTIDKITDECLKSTQVLVYGSCNILEDNKRYTHLEVSLDAFDIATKEYLFSKSADARVYKGTEEPAIKFSTMPIEARDAIQRDLIAAVKKSVGQKKNFDGVEKVVFVPLQPSEGGDEGDSEFVEWDRYAEHAFVSAVSGTALTPVKTDATTIFDVRRQLIETKANLGDGLMWCALRGVDVRANRKSFFTWNYEVSIDLQAQVEKAGGREVVWSDVFMVTTVYEENLSFWDWLFAGDLAKYGEADTLASKGLRVVAWIAGGIVILVILGSFIRATKRVR